MTNEKLMDIIVVLDRSGSMQIVREQTVAGFNTYLEDQRKQPGDTNITLVQFDDVYESVYADVPVKQAALLNATTYVPRGSTALLDAIGRTITQRGATYAAMQEHARPGKVVLVIVTDGEENASKEFTRQQVFDMIKHQQENYNWGVLYLGANQDAIRAGAGIGVPSGMAVNYSSTPTGARASFGAAANYSNTVRGMSAGQSLKSCDVDQNDREALKLDKPVEIRPTPPHAPWPKMS